MNAQDFKLHYMSEEDYWEVYDPEGLTPCELVYEGDEEISHKTVFQTSVYKVGGQYFEVTSTRDNTGYWSDGERYEPEVREVVPQEELVKVVRWVPV